MQKPAYFQSFWRKFINNPEYRSLNNPNVPINDLSLDYFGFGNSNESGEPVTPNTALKLAAVYRANRILCDTIASLPLNVYEKSSNGSKSVAVDHDINYLLEKEPNGLQTSYTFREIMQGSVNMDGNGLAKIHRKKGSITDLEWLPQRLISAKVKGFKAFYDYKIDAETTETIKGSDMIHVPNYGHDGFWGLGVLDVATEAIGSSLAQQKFTSRLIKNNAQPSAVLINKSVGMTEEQREQNKKNWQSAHGGSNQGGVAVMNGEWDLKTFSITPEQAQLLESKKFGVLEVARFFGVEPHLLFDLDRATYSNIEEQGIEYVTYTIRGIVKRWEHELNRKLFTEEEKRSGKYFCKFNLNGLLRADSKSRAEYYKMLFEMAAIKPTEIRDFEGWNIDDAADEYFIASNNFTKVSDLGKEQQNED